MKGVFIIVTKYHISQKEGQYNYDVLVILRITQIAY